MACVQLKPITVSAPGSVMLLGEHAVLHDYPAIAIAINQRLQVNLLPRQDTTIRLHSAAFGYYQTDLNDLKVEPPYQFILAALQAFKDQLNHGFELDIESEFAANLGLGSSAAITVATVQALSLLLAKNLSTFELFTTCLHIVRQVQGIGSGADLAASILGGIIYLQPLPLQITRIADSLPISLIYAGYKTPTVTVVKQVQHAANQYPIIYHQLYQTIGTCVRQARAYLQPAYWHQLADIINLQQGLMTSLGVTDASLQQLITLAQQTPGILAAKISGSGLGDCIITLGTPDQPFTHLPAGAMALPVKASAQGIYHDPAAIPPSAHR